MCVNVPAATDGTWTRFRYKFYLFTLAVLGPEFVLMLAFGQLQSARRSVAVRCKH